MIRFAVAFVLLLAVSGLEASAQSADIRITPWSSRDRHFMFTVYNWGPAVAQDVVLLVDIPAALELEGPTDPRCDTTVRPVRCFTPALALTGDSLAFEFSVRTPTANATYTITARAESSTPDPDLSNNTASFTFQTTITAELSNLISRERVRVDPGATQVFVTSVSNFVDTYPSDVRIRYTANNATIEAIEAVDPRWTCTFSGNTGECFAPAGLEPNCRCSGDIRVTVRASSTRGGGEGTLEMSSTSSLPANESHAAVATLQTYRVLPVTNTADAGPGSLRATIDEANASCNPGPCKIAFEIPGPVPPEGWFTIDPRTPLPAITAARVAVDGLWQTRFTGDTNPHGPEIAIDGHRALEGLQMRAPCEAIVQGLALGRFFTGYGLTFASGTCESIAAGDQKLVTRNHLGVDPSGTVAWPNLRGLDVDGFALVEENVISRNLLSGVWWWRGTAARFVRNTIAANGRSGIVLGPETSGGYVFDNKIRDQAEMGVAVVRGAKLFVIRRNSMIDNGGLGIDIGLDGRSPVDRDDDDLLPSNAPVLLWAAYDAATDSTLVTMTLRSRRLGPYFASFSFDFYSNRGPHGDGEQWIGTAGLFSGDHDGTPFTIRLHGNYAGKWINATSTRAHTSFSRPPDRDAVSAQLYSGEGQSTSELSNMILVAP